MHYDDVTPEDLREFLTRRLASPRAPGRTIVVAIPAPFAPLETFLDAAGGELGLLWSSPSDEQSFAAVGAAHRIDVAGDDRVAQLDRATRELFGQLDVDAYPGHVAPQPRLFGGLAFCTHANHVPPWTDFGDGCFTLPRWTYARDAAEGASLLLALAPDDAATLGDQVDLLEELDRILFALEAHDRAGTASVHYRDLESIPFERVEQLGRDAWRAHIEAIRAGVREGTFEKVVAARRCVVKLPRPIADTTVLGRLAVQHPETTRFAFRRAGATLVCATPETLFVKRGRTLSTEALAGTIKSTDSEFPAMSLQSRKLIGSAKDRDEHAYVVRQIMEALRPLSEKVEAPPLPLVRKVRNIIHLNTPISATLREGVHAMALLERMHPTPAVGGFPTEVAVRWIAEHEPHARGWYTGAAGWIDAAGDATFNVVIRCGLVQGGRVVYVYTGAGIVAGSDPDAEYAETELKQTPLLRAVGVDI